MFYKSILRPFLFLWPAETVHHFVMAVLKWSGRIPGIQGLFASLYKINDRRLETTVAGITFPNRVGLAAGFDKDAKAFNELGSLGFGFVEIGTVTPRPQEGNPRPRLFRLPADCALINRMGFNNDGIVAVAGRLAKKRNVIIGGNIGKNKITPNENAHLDYLECFESLYPYVDYFVINISSPNTPGLRELQEREPLIRLLEAIQSANRVKEVPRPLFLKIAPDLEYAQVDDIVDIIRHTSLSGIVISNTTISRAGLKTSPSELDSIGAGGLSGKPVFERSTNLVKYVAQKSSGSFAIIASGGIFNAEDALKKLDAGADLVQLYTGFIYEGPALIKSINKALLDRSRKQ